MLTTMIQAIAVLLLTAIIAIGCVDYRIEINDRLIYSPTPLFTDFLIADKALNNCVKQHISSEGITAASQLSNLNCGHAGIDSLLGLESFSKLEGLKLSHNQIGDLGPIVQLTLLQQLYLDNNKLSDISPLALLRTLKTIDLHGNEKLSCAHVEATLGNHEIKIILPEQCN